MKKVIIPSLLPPIATVESGRWTGCVGGGIIFHSWSFTNQLGKLPMLNVQTATVGITKNDNNNCYRFLVCCYEDKPDPF